MDFMKSDSLLSNIKNVSIRIDMRPNDGSNIFKSMFSNIQQKQKSIKLESLFDFDSNLHNSQQGNSLIGGLSFIHPKQNPTQAYHYNWLVCKNAGLSQEEDNDNQNYHQRNHKHKQIIQMKTDSKSHEERPKEIQKPTQNVNHVQQKKIKNETKNIPKNYGKAIICFIQKYKQKVIKIAEHYNVDYYDLLDDLKKKKRTINTIADLRNLWSKYKYAKCMRVISFEFFRKHAFSYIFDSRICTYGSHIKYRQRLCQAVSSPEDFKHIKDY